MHRDLNHENQIFTLKEQQIQKLEVGISRHFLSNRKFIFLEYIKLRKVVNDEFEEVDHGKIDIFNLCYSTTSFFLISRYSRALSLS